MNQNSSFSPKIQISEKQMINEIQQLFSFSLDACIKTNYGLRHDEKSEDVGDNKKSIIINEEYCVLLND